MRILNFVDHSDTKIKEGEDVDGIRESHDTNVTRSRISDDSGLKKTFQYKKGPVIDSDNPFAEVCECLDLVMGERLAIKTYKVLIPLSKEFYEYFRYMDLWRDYKRS